MPLLTVGAQERSPHTHEVNELATISPFGETGNYPQIT